MYIYIDTFLHVAVAILTYLYFDVFTCIYNIYFFFDIYYMYIYIYMCTYLHIFTDLHTYNLSGATGPEANGNRVKPCEICTAGRIGELLIQTILKTPRRTRTAAPKYKQNIWHLSVFGRVYCYGLQFLCSLKFYPPVIF